LKSIDGLFHQKEKVPEEWDYVELEKLTDEKSAIRMGPFGSSLKKEELVGKGIMTLWIENVVNNEFSWDYKQYITKEKFEELRGFEVKPDDVLITMMGTIGRVAIVPKDIGTAIITSHLLKITLDQKKCLPKFLYYFLQSYFIHRQLLRESRGIVMSGLNTKIIKSLLIKVPKLPEQKKIALILSNIDELIQKQQQVIEQTQKLMKGQMQKLLTQGIGHEYPQEFKEKDWLFGTKILIPEEWKLSRLSENIELKNGFAFESEFFVDKSDKVVITPGNFHKDGGFYFEDRNTTFYKGKIPDGFILKNGDLLVVMTDLTRDGIILGNSIILDSEYVVLHNQRIAKIMVEEEKLDKYFLNYFFNSFLSKQQIKRTAAGTGVIHTSSEKILELLILIPPLPEQQKIASILSNLDSLIQQEKQYKEKLQKIKRGLMQQLLTGKTRVKV
jgi:type I restriction enzyme, S subunit